jgi:hypothetical protein
VGLGDSHFSRRSTGPLSSDVPRGDGTGRGAWPLGGRSLFRCRLASSSLYHPTISLRTSSRVRVFLFSSGGGDLGVSTGVRRWSLLVLWLGESCAILAECGRLVCFLPFALDAALLPLPGDSFGADGSGSSSSMWSGMAAPDCWFLFHRQSGSGRWVFIVLGTPRRALDVGSCGGSNVWSRAPVMLGGGLLGFRVHQFLGLVQSCGRRRRSPVVMDDHDVVLCVTCLIFGVFFVKRFYIVLPGVI